MSSITLDAIWIGSWKATTEEAKTLHSYILREATIRGFGHLLTNVTQGSNGLVQFMLMPCGSKEGYPQTKSWEDLAVHAAFACAGSSFHIKRLHLGSN